MEDENDRGFDVIIGMEVTYVLQANLPLFATANELVSSNKNINQELEPALHAVFFTESMNPRYFQLHINLGFCSLIGGLMSLQLHLLLA